MTEKDEIYLKVKPEAFERLVRMPTCKLKLEALRNEELELKDLGGEETFETGDEGVDRDEMVFCLEGEEETGRPGECHIGGRGEGGGLVIESRGARKGKGVRLECISLERKQSCHEHIAIRLFS